VLIRNQVFWDLTQGTLVVDIFHEEFAAAAYRFVQDQRTLLKKGAASFSESLRTNLYGAIFRKI
jgi:hypothetical protein